MAEPTETPAPATKGFTIPTTVVTGVLIAVVVGVAYIFFGPDAAKAVCSALL